MSNSFFALFCVCGCVLGYVCACVSICGPRLAWEDWERGGKVIVCVCVCIWCGVAGTTSVSPTISVSVSSCVCGPMKRERQIEGL